MTLIDEKVDNTLEKAILDNLGNKYKLVIKAAREAKKIKEKEKIESLGKLALKSLERIVLKREKENIQEKEEEKEEKK